ncbi:hypothetical protein VQL36_13235 [Chengkuizengella sp. SCS-71B]|uniref:hypothetical protein n=1 Tax=Chengkuizengella sp. SCS-71B TaxID=3115290 RepID=UPI0032C21193
MGLKKGILVVADTVSVDDPYDPGDENIIILSNDGDFEIVATVDVCVKDPQKTQVCIDSMAQIAICNDDGPPSVTFEVTYELLRNGTTIATISDEMDYARAGADGRHTNFPNFPLVDNNPCAGINTYELRITRVSTNAEGDIFVASRSLKATVFTV